MYRDLTTVGSGVYLMQSVHIPHDAIIDDAVVITPMVALAGVSTIQQGTNLAMGSSVHQYMTTGAYSMVATGAPVVTDLPPFALLLLNEIGERRGAQRSMRNTHVAPS